MGRSVRRSKKAKPKKSKPMFTKKQRKALTCGCLTFPTIGTIIAIFVMLLIVI